MEEKLTRIAEELTNFFGVEEMICRVCGYDTEKFYYDDEF